MIPLLLLLACTSSTPGDSADGGSSTDGGATDGGTAADGGGTSDGGGDGGTTAELYGSPPDEAIPAPEFAATNMDGGARSREDLLGHPTVMWFYPAAATAG